MSLLDASSAEPWERSLPVSDVELEGFGLEPDPTSRESLDDDSDLLALDDDDEGLLDDDDEDDDEDEEEEDDEDEDEEDDDAFYRMGEDDGLDVEDEEF